MTYGSPRSVRPIPGRAAIVPSRPDESVLIEQRDVIRRRPPDASPEAARRLSESGVETLREWTRSGAAYEQHWSFAADPFGPPPAVPTPFIRSTPSSPSELRQRGLRPSPPADPPPAAAAGQLDLIGLPPTEEDLDRISRGAVRGTTATDYKALRTLESGWPADWLDAARRYADTDG